MVAPAKANGADADFALKSTTELKFTSDNWDTLPRITVSAAEDTDSDAGTATINHTVSRGDYGSNIVTADNVAVYEVDDETLTTP